MYYCCVKGCKNNIGKTDSGSITFYTFPQNTDLKAKWLEAIGRSHWDAPSNALVCSDHFDQDLETCETTKSLLKNNDALPVHNIPPISKLDTTALEVCSMCLATDVKMYNSQGEKIKSTIEQLVGISDKLDISGLPLFICYMCAAEVHKCCQFIDKCITAQATLLDVFGKHGKITKTLIKNINRNELNLNKSLSTSKQTNIMECNYENDVNNFTKILDRKVKKESSCKVELIDLQNDIKAESDDEVIIIVKSPMNDENNDSDHEMIIENDNVESQDNDEKTLKIVKKALTDINSKKKKKRTGEKYISKNIKDDLTGRDVKIKQYFNIVKLPLQEQIDEWNRKSSRPPIMGYAEYQCDTCPKQFAHFKPFSDHQRLHDKSRGDVECPVCRARFKSEALAEQHRRFTHEKKYYCKICPKIISNVRTAIRHHLRHSGVKQKKKRAIQKIPEEYSCTICGVACETREQLNSHVETTHGEIMEPKGDESFRCEICDINFTTEDARTLHSQTSVRHEIKSKSLDESKTCYSCGMEFSTESELTLHMKTQHKRKPYTKLSSRTYPVKCEYCDKTMNNRREHWWHTSKEHPDKKDSYRRVITVICDTCGQGFQNITKLHIHELRHASPSVRCDECGRAFYDKYGLERHARTHTRARPYACDQCGLTFSLRPNLHRHAKVHSNVAAYECSICDKKFKYTTSRNLHIRTVHCKQPLPPRKKRSKTVVEPQLKVQ